MCFKIACLSRLARMFEAKAFPEDDFFVASGAGNTLYIIIQPKQNNHTASKKNFHS